MSRLTASAIRRAYGLPEPNAAGRQVKNGNRRTYDFYRSRRRTDRQSDDRGVYDLLVDGWSAYYRWLAELKKRLPAPSSSRQPE